ncbi:hypothetical protein Pmani_012787 [Petrolisthes manimaculis]|uniref:Uncharacterized protein n=1 Tax=Petrolisthes manimaculis TaxID=1843537 RepID=A0AAE1UA72_9EUCA|nr:hypothetical protein Pmani_012787 [Petrolisthes manimaculis]
MPERKISVACARNGEGSSRAGVDFYRNCCHPLHIHTPLQLRPHPPSRADHIHSPSTAAATAASRPPPTRAVKPHNHTLLQPSTPQLCRDRGGSSSNKQEKRHLRRVTSSALDLTRTPV